MGRIVYHDQSGISGQSSPFDEAVLEVAQSGSVDIVSPYIGVDYLQRIIQVSDGWRLISDIEAWLSSLSISARPKAWSFIRENIESIHHCTAIHAKAVISKKLAMFGSANLTKTGILARTELGVLIDDPKLVSELGTWFDSLWSQTLPPIADETNAFVQWLDEISERTPARRERFTLTASGQKIRTRLVKLPAQTQAKLEGSPLNLDVVAQSLFIQEQNHCESLEEAIEAAINALVKDVFSFGQVLSIMRISFSTATVREIYFALIQHCANHARSVFAENTRNRLIFKDAKFTQSTKDQISEALAPFDLFLTILIHHFDFDRARDFPDETSIAKETGINGEEQIILVSELIDCGFLDLDDVAGSLPQYKLMEDFGWIGRYRLFETAMHDWTAKESHYVKSRTEFPEIASQAKRNERPSKVKIVYGNEKSEPAPQLKDNKFLSDYTSHVHFDHEEHQKPQKDRLISVILDRLLTGEQLQISNELASQLSNKVGIRKQVVLSYLLGRGIGLPDVILFEDTSIRINPDFDWEDLKGYPLTQKVCRKFLQA